VLSDKEKRQRYDMYGKDAEQMGDGGNPFGGRSPHDIFRFKISGINMNTVKIINSIGTHLILVDPLAFIKIIIVIVTVVIHKY
jgi:hypothetical protein